MKNILDIQDLMIEQLRELNDGEQYLHDFLASLEEAAFHQGLIRLLEDYRETTRDNHLTLIQVFNDLFTEENGERCAMLRALSADTKRLVGSCKTKEIRDAAIILGLQHLIHYKIATYGAVCTYAKVLGVYDDGAKLHDLLLKEKKTDRRLAALADMDIDRSAFNYRVG